MAIPRARCVTATVDVIESQLSHPDQWMVGGPPMGGNTDLSIVKDF